MTYDDHDDDWVNEDDGDESEMLACPACGEAVYEEAQQCPHCGDWIVPVDPAERGRRLIWAVAGTLIVISMLLYTIL